MLGSGKSFSVRGQCERLKDRASPAGSPMSSHCGVQSCGGSGRVKQLRRQQSLLLEMSEKTGIDPHDASCSSGGQGRIHELRRWPWARF